MSDCSYSESRCENTVSFCEAVLWEDDWRDFLSECFGVGTTSFDENGRLVDEEVRKKTRLFQRLIIFLKKISQPNGDQEDNNSEDWENVLSGLGKDALHSLWKKYRPFVEGIVEKENSLPTPFEPNINDREVIQRTANVLLLHLFRLSTEDNILEDLVLRLAAAVKGGVFGIKLDKGLFTPVVCLDFISLGRDRSGRNKTLPDLGYTPIRGGIRIFPPIKTKSGDINVGDWCLEVIIDEPSLAERKANLSYRGRDPGRVLTIGEEKQEFGRLVYVDYRNRNEDGRRSPRKLILSLVEIQSGKGLSNMGVELKKFE